MKTAEPSVALFMHDLSVGGVERMRLRLAAGLASHGHKVTIIVQCARGPLRSEIPHGVDLIELNQPRIWAAIGPLAEVLRKRRPDVLISSLDHNNIAALIARLIVGNSTKVIICQHNTLSEEAATSWRYRVVPILYRILAGWADGVVAVSEGVAEDLSRASGIARGRIAVIYNPIVQIPVAASPSELPHPWLSDQSVPVFIFAGRLVAQKDPLLLLRAFAARLSKGPARLIFLGEGPLLAELQLQAAALGIGEAVYFAGFVPDPRPWMARATSVVLPSLYEGFGNVIVEALSCGTPVIATNCQHGPDEILAGGRFGWLVPVGDCAALTAAMADDARASLPAAKLIQRASCFSMGACVSKHRALFDQVLSPRERVVFGLSFSTLDVGTICARLCSENTVDSIRVVAPQNLDTVRLLRQNTEFLEACRAATLVCPDGFPVAIYAWLRGVGGGARVTGCDIFQRLASTATDHGRRTIVVVESLSTALRLREWARERRLYPNWEAIVAPLNLLNDLAGECQLVSDIVIARPEILVMALGAPVSEIFLYKNRNLLPPCWAVCCGQAVRVELGLEDRAPSKWQKLNLEWAWRLLREPRRLGPRYLRDALSIAGLIAADLRVGPRPGADSP